MKLVKKIYKYIYTLCLYILVHALGEGRIQLAICVKMCVRRTGQGQRRRGKKMARPDEKEKIKNCTRQGQIRRENNST